MHASFEMKLSIAPGSLDDAPSIVLLRNAVAAQLTAEHGQGHWSSCVTAQTVSRELRESQVLVARSCGELVATLRLATKKPWAIDASYFTGVAKALYLHGMAVHPPMQRRGIGRELVAQAKVLAQRWPAGAIRLDAYDSPAGATPFYESCGFREMGRIVYRRTPLVYLEFVF
jgi:GNAT superfamily N-acetyltransferase